MHVGAQPPERSHIDISGGQHQLLGDHRSLVDPIDRGAVHSSDLVLLDDFEPLCGDPWVTDDRRDLPFVEERPQGHPVLDVLDRGVPDFLRVLSDLTFGNVVVDFP